MKIVITSEELNNLVLEVQDKHEILKVAKNWFGDYIVARRTERQTTKDEPQKDLTTILREFVDACKKIQQITKDEERTGEQK